MIRSAGLAAAIAAAFGVSVPAFADPAALVALATARIQSFHPRISVYGTIAPDANSLASVSLSRDVIVTRVSVRVGERVKAGDPLFTVQTAAQAGAAYQQADSAYQFAAKDLAHTRQLFAEQLATNSQLAAAVKALDDAKAALAAQEAIGSGTQSQTLRAAAAGVVTALDVSPGQRVAANTTMASIATKNRFIVNLGLEPSVAAQIAPGDPVKLHPPQDPSQAMSGKIASVDAMVDPKSRLVNAIAYGTGAGEGRLVLGAVLEADVWLSARTGIVVPHSALMADARGSYVFAVAEGVAHRRNVRVAFDTPQNALVAQGLRAGEQVVTAGNAELEDGMHVRVH